MIYHCCIKGCKRQTAYQTFSGNPPVKHYCAKHWKEHIEADPAFMNAVKTWEDSLFPRGKRRDTKTQTRRKIVRRSTKESASVTVRRVVRKKK